MKRISFTEPATRDIDQIYRYIGSDNLEAAVKHRQRLEKRWIALLSHPRMGTKQDAIEPNLRSVTEGNYAIYYRILSDGIEVVRVLHTSMDAVNAFEQMQD